jgi:hypothetical protein
MIDRDSSTGRAERAPDEKQRRKAELEAEGKLIDSEWNEVQSQIRELLQTRGKTEEQITDEQWQVEALLRRADQIHSRSSELTSQLLHL